MFEFYQKKANDMSLPEPEREQYAKMAKAMMNKEEADELKKKIKAEQEEEAKLAEVEDEGCAGGACKI